MTTVTTNTVTPRPAKTVKPGEAGEAVKRSAPDHRLRWPEAVAITVALLLAGAVAAGWFSPMLPWLA